MKNARYYASKAVCISLKGGYSQLVIDSVLKDCTLSSVDKSFASSLFYGVMERKILLEKIVSQRCKKKPDKEVEAILLTGLYQLLFMPSIPQSAVCNESAGLAKEFKKTSASSFINGVLRSFLREGCPLPKGENEVEELCLKYSASKDVTDAFIGWLGKEGAEQALSNSLGRPPVFIRVNTLKTDEDSLIEALKKEKIIVEKTDFPNCLVSEGGNIAHTKAFNKGLFIVCDRMSQRCAEAVKAKKGERILDLCSAPGTKAFIMAQCMENEGEIVACDVSNGRINLIKEGQERLGVKIITTVENDASCKNKDFEKNKFDRILCDVPCSGFGVIRRKPELKYRKKEDFINIENLQYEILSNASKYLKAGGTLIYSTCTINPLENEENIKKFLEANPDFTPLSIEGESYFIKNNIGQDCSDGFFVAGMEKK